MPVALSFQVTLKKKKLKKKSRFMLVIFYYFDKDQINTVLSYV